MVNKKEYTLGSRIDKDSNFYNDTLGVYNEYKRFDKSNMNYEKLITVLNDKKEKEVKSQSEISIKAIPKEMMPIGESYALTVEGDSMINEGIHNGDTVLIKKTNIADNGEIVVALIDDNEATLKRIRKKGQSIALESANPIYETRILSAHRVKIQGKLIGLLRKY